MSIKFATRFIGVSGVALGAYILLFRPWQQRWGATDKEIKCMLPGDELVPHPDINLTRAVTIQATSTEVWSWLVQIGQGRGGYYTYDWLENLLGLKMKNAEAINPEWQHIYAGDIIPAEPGGKGFKVLIAEPARVMVIGSVEANDEGVFEAFKQMFPAFTWSFVLTNVESEQTRLISRLRGQAQPTRTVAARIAGFFFEPIEFLMTHKMLLGIKQRAEQASFLAVGKSSHEKSPKSG